MGPSWDYRRSLPEQGLMTSACPWGNACGEECCSLRELCLAKARMLSRQQELKWLASWASSWIVGPGGWRECLVVPDQVYKSISRTG